MLFCIKWAGLVQCLSEHETDIFVCDANVPIETENTITMVSDSVHHKACAMPFCVHQF